MFTGRRATLLLGSTLRLGAAAATRPLVPAALGAGRRAICVGAGSAFGLATLGLAAPSALAEEAPGSWAKHLGAFSDDEFADFKVTSTGLRYAVLKEGEGVQPKKGQNIKCHYSGFLLSGKKFDSSYDRKAPLKFAVGTSQVIAGWDEALLDMHVGERRVLVVPPALAYGSRGAGGVIPPEATLVSYVELVTLAA